MAEKKKKEEEVLLVRDEKTGEISVVAGLNKDGTPKRTPANQKHAQDFLRFDRNGDALTTFLTNFYRQCKEPNRFGFYRVAVDGMEKVMEVLKDFLKDPETYKDLLAPHKVDTSAYEQQVAQEQATGQGEQSHNEQGEQSQGEGQDGEEQQAEMAEGENQEQEQGEVQEEGEVQEQGEAQEEDEAQQMQGESETPTEETVADGEEVTSKVTNEAADEEVAEAADVTQTVMDGEQPDVMQEQESNVTQEQEPDVAGQTQAENAPAPQLDENGFNWAALEQQWGISLQELTDSKELNNLNKNGLSNLITIHPEIAGQRYEIQARLEVKTMPDGSKNFEPHFIQKEPKLDMPYKDIEFTDADRKNLQENGNLGRVVEIVDKETGEIIPSYISIDRQTNEITDIPVSDIKIPQKIGKTEFAKAEQDLLAAGLPLKKEIELNNKQKFTATLQVNVQYKGVEFVPKNKSLGQKKSQWQGKKEQQTSGKRESPSAGERKKTPDGDGNTTQTQGNNKANQSPGENKPQTGQEQKQQQSTWLTKEGTIRPIGKWKGQLFDEQQKKDYVAGKTVVLQNATDKQGNPCTLYIKFDWEKGRPVSDEKEPNVKQATEVIPSNESRTQMAVNNDGATNEATKHTGEPLKQGQVAPANERQQERQQQGQQSGERQGQGQSRQRQGQQQNEQADAPKKPKGLRI